ncbi:unnamed protein product [Rotaria sordida]|uniref:Aldehyde oxidase/xanthine dehydrogenase a/b hammerhead domain-containing protein n=1 Tax=Rotaria sordida TaxID=392033 RepID=A0A819CWP0_9BILA|nr:unnamed protein product [Rotaria sordida]
MTIPGVQKPHCEPNSSAIQDIEEAFDGNLCRCTGYRPILDAAKTFAKDINKLHCQQSSPTTSITLDKCISFASQNSSPPDQVEFPQQLRHHIPPSIHIKDISAASRVLGFVSFVSHTDIPGSNNTGVFMHDEEVFVSFIAQCVGAVIGVVLCESERSAHMASDLVQIEYELLTPTMFTIDDAIEKESYFGDELCLRRGDINNAFANAEHTLEGTDVGTPLNPQIDIGQIEGAFMQGIDLFTMEELAWGDQSQQKWIKPGTLFTRGPSSYKIPSFNDVPLDMRVSFLSNAPNPRVIYSSKGIGEPPLSFDIAVFFALKHACMAYREQQGFTEHFQLHSPATVERL